MHKPIAVLVVIQLSLVYFCNGNVTTEYFTTEYFTTKENSTEIELPVNDTQGKHKTISKCPSFDLEPDEYVMFANGTAYVEAYNQTYNDSFYILRGDILTVCVPEIPDTDIVISQTEHFHKMSVLTQIGLGISMVCLLLHLVVFCFVPDLRNLPGCNLASLCSSLLLSYVFFIVGGSGKIGDFRGLCIAAAALTQFFLLASFLWMSVMAFDVYKSLLNATGSLRISSTQFKWKKFGFYNFLAWGIAMTLTAAALITDNVEGVPEIYKPVFERTCWFDHRRALLVFFAGPVFAMICLNLSFFGLSTYTLFHNRMRNDQDSQRSILKKNYLMYCRLAVIMGVTWITGVLAPVVNSQWLWYLYAALNTLQGLFIFLAFTCTGKVKRYFRAKWLGARRPSAQTLAPTFQSYCFYANSIEKDLNKVVDSDKGKSDTIMIHL